MVMGGNHVELGAVTRWLSGGTPSRKVSSYWSGDIPWISAFTLKKIEVTESDQCVTADAVSAGSKMAPLNSTLLLVRGSALHNEIRAGIVCRPVCFNQDVKALIPSRNILPKYLTYSILGSERQLLKLVSSAGNTAGVLDTKLVQAFRIWVPELKEQRAITTALNDIDALLEGLEHLIMKKRDLKQAAMQQLLTGQTRLPGFHGEWKAELLSNVSWFQEGPGVRNYQFTASGVKLFNGTNIDNGRIDLEKTDRHISKSEAYGAYSHFLAEEGDIVIACSGVSVDRFEEKVAVITLAHLPLCMNTSTMRFKVFQNYLHDNFLLHFLRSNQFKKQIGGTATGSAQLNFGPSHVSNVSILIPELHEQKAIAEVLSTLDAEIEAVEQRRKKTAAIKQAMMQELLTGRTRLI